MIIDYTQETVILAVIGQEENEKVVALGQYGINTGTHTAEIAFAVLDEYQDAGIGSELLAYLTYLAKRQGLLGFTAEVLVENKPMLRVFEKGGFDMERSKSEGVWELKMVFRETGNEINNGPETGDQYGKAAHRVSDFLVSIFAWLIGMSTSSFTLTPLRNLLEKYWLSRLSTLAWRLLYDMWTN